MAARLGSNWLLGTVAINLILISVFGSLLIDLFGFVTNAGNGFYASVFLATHFLLERHGREMGLKVIWFGLGGLLLFTILAQLTIRLTPIAESQNYILAASFIFDLSTRVTLASIIAYIFAQYINIYIYEWLRLKTRARHLWVRTNVANFFGQAVDSLLFFSIAFPDLAGPILVQAILIGFVVKVIIGLFGTPFLYLDHSLNLSKRS